MTVMVLDDGAPRLTIYSPVRNEHPTTTTLFGGSKKTEQRTVQNSTCARTTLLDKISKRASKATIYYENNDRVEVPVE